MGQGIERTANGSDLGVIYPNSQVKSVRLQKEAGSEDCHTSMQTSTTMKPTFLPQAGRTFCSARRGE